MPREDKIRRIGSDREPPRLVGGGNRHGDLCLPGPGQAAPKGACCFKPMPSPGSSWKTLTASSWVTASRSSAS